MSKELMNMLSEFLVSEIGSKAMDGITYALVLDSDKAKEKKYKSIYAEVRRHGYEPGEMFGAWQVSNGYIFDLDLGVAKQLMIKIANVVKNMKAFDGDPVSLVGERPEKRRKSDMVKLSKLLLNRYEKGERVTSVALWSRNSTPYIFTSGKDSTGYVTEKFDAYAVRHVDLEIVNEKLLIPKGIRICRVEPFDILPRSNGVRFDVYVDKL